jgi:predicted MFS family arabinose efflux permease
LAVRSAAFWAWRSAGLVADAWGWRAAFLIAGAPGLIMAVVAALTLVEPRRALKAKMAAEAADAPAFGAALREILGSRALKFMVTGGAAKALFTYGLTAFVGSFFRNHGDQLAEIAAGFGLQTIGFVGIALGVTLGAAGIIGSYSGGYLTDRFGARDRRAYGVIPGIGRICAVPLYILALSVDDAMVALMILAPAQALSTMWPGPIYAMIQGLVGPRVRATATAVQLFMANLIGLGLGLLFLGITSDFYAKGLGMGSAEGVRYAIITFALSGIPAGLMFVFGAKTLREEMVN